MPDIKLRTIPEPIGGGVLAPQLKPGQVLIRGTAAAFGDLNYICGKCERTLVATVSAEVKFENVVVHCPCGAYNNLSSP